MKILRWPWALFFLVSCAIFGGRVASANILPCYKSAECFTEQIPKLTLELPVRPEWHKRLDNVELRMRQDADYSVLFNNQKDRIPFIHTPESVKAVDEFAGSVMSTLVEPLAPMLPLYTQVYEQRDRVNLAVQQSMPVITTKTYSVKFQPRADFSQTNPVSMDVKVRNGGELAVLSLRLRETELKVPLYPGLLAVGGYSYRNSNWYVYLAGKMAVPW